ncbi:hypothetical protein HK097_010642 [Rhizophlyctis rosea]|uniref:Uncharacterized protein n=1 Tax=Rhizophlyctis rosea TaxID=64517 RepID=A0AAD5S8Y0_9FUNG|nr:hypothetical protein HK097_010642 [Rhizophlyctis rosea]
MPTFFHVAADGSTSYKDATDLNDVKRQLNIDCFNSTAVHIIHHDEKSDTFNESVPVIFDDDATHKSLPCNRRIPTLLGEIAVVAHIDYVKYNEHGEEIFNRSILLDILDAFHSDLSTP